jgi:hypothetical protein
LKLPCCIFTVAERKQSKAVISFDEWNWKSCSAALQFRTPFERFFLLFKSRTSSALQFYPESQGRANGRSCNWRLQFGKNMSKCKYTYMYFPLYKQVVLSEETVFNEGEGYTDPQALHYGIHLLKSLPRTRKIIYFFLPLFCSIK